MELADVIFMWKSGSHLCLMCQRHFFVTQWSSHGEHVETCGCIMSFHGGVNRSRNVVQIALTSLWTKEDHVLEIFIHQANLISQRYLWHKSFPSPSAEAPFSFGLLVGRHLEQWSLKGFHSLLLSFWLLSVPSWMPLSSSMRLCLITSLLDAQSLNTEFKNAKITLWGKKDVVK